MTRSRGQSVLYVVLTIPVLILVLALAVDVAALQLQRLRLTYAVDLATVAAVTDVDTAAYTRTGQLQLDALSASTTAREYLFRNLVTLPDIGQPESIAQAADIAVVNQTPAVSPCTGRRLSRPTVCARIRVPYRLSLLGWIGLNEVNLTVAAESEIRT